MRAAQGVHWQFLKSSRSSLTLVWRHTKVPYGTLIKLLHDCYYCIITCLFPFFHELKLTKTFSKSNLCHSGVIVCFPDMGAPILNFPQDQPN